MWLRFWWSHCSAWGPRSWRAERKEKLGDKAKDALDMREHEKLKDAAEDARDAAKDAGAAVKEEAESLKEKAKAK